MTRVEEITCGNATQAVNAARKVAPARRWDDVAHGLRADWPPVPSMAVCVRPFRAGKAQLLVLHCTLMHPISILVVSPRQVFLCRPALRRRPFNSEAISFFFFFFRIWTQACGVSVSVVIVTAVTLVFFFVRV